MGDETQKKCYPLLRGMVSDRRVTSRRLLLALYFTTQMVESVAREMINEPQRPFWQAGPLLGHAFSVTRDGGMSSLGHGEGTISVLNSVKTWLRAHEEAQVMLASILVVVGLWWLVRTILALLINLVCPLLVVLLAVVLVPQLRGPLLGQNYPALANVLHTILTKMAENIKQD